MANEIIHIPPGDSSVYVDWGDGTSSSGTAGVGYNNSSGNTYKGALRFENVQIPKNASINSAGVNIKVGQRTGTSNVFVKIWGVDEDNSGTGNPFSRTVTTAFNTHDSNPNQGDYFGIGVGNIIEEIVSRSGWVQGNALHFIFDDNGTSKSSSSYILDFNANNFQDSSFLNYRINAEPNFKPTPKSVTAPTLPTATDYGIKISKPGVSVLTATEADTYFSTRKKQFKVLIQAYYQSVVADVTAGFKTIAHNLGYIPFASIYVKSSVFGGGWKKLPQAHQFEDHPTYYIDDTNIYLHSAVAGEEFYYYIYNDQLAT